MPSPANTFMMRSPSACADCRHCTSSSLGCPHLRRVVQRRSPACTPAPKSIPDVLQEPLGRNLAAETGAFHRLVDLAGDRIKLRALQVAAFGIGDLVGRGAAFDPPLDQVGKRDALL